MPIEYELAMPRPHTHLFEVELRVPAPPENVELVLPTWTPGSYLIREFARNVQDFEAHDASGLRLGWRKVTKNVWRVEGRPTGDLVVRYRVHANELTVRTSHLDASHGYVNGASIFMYPRGLEGEPARLTVVAPRDWRVATSLHETESGVFVAEDYHELIDCPLEIGPHESIAWVQEGAPHRFAVWGDDAADGGRLIGDTRRIIDVCSRMFGGLPYDRYLFILHVLPEVRGGLEHRNSSSLQVPRSALSDPGYESLLALIAHEFFHVWLGKRIRPEPLGPFDYSSENYTRNLWVVEGFTTYYTDLILVRARLMTPERYLERLGDSIARLRSLPGRFHQTLEESSFDAWIRFYRPDANTPNSQISYYHKGALVALVLDLEIRRATAGERSLDDVMRILWERYGSRDVGFPEDGPGGIRDVVEEVLGGPVDGIFADYVSGVAEIDFERHLEAVGLELTVARRREAGVEAPAEAAVGAEGAERAETGAEGAPDAGVAVDEAPAEAAEQGSPADRPAPRIEPPGSHEQRLGIRLRDDRGRLMVTHVLAGTAAYDAGVNAGDELVAIGDAHPALEEVARIVDELATGDRIELTLARRGRIVRVLVEVPEPPERSARLLPAADAPPDASRLRREWLAPA